MSGVVLGTGNADQADQHRENQGREAVSVVANADQRATLRREANRHPVVACRVGRPKARSERPELRPRLADGGPAGLIFLQSTQGSSTRAAGHSSGDVGSS